MQNERRWLVNLINILRGPSSDEGPGHDERVGCKTWGVGGGGAAAAAAQGGGIGAGGGGAATGFGGV